ncbi:hypothetical protein CN374_00070 [Bacillus cereus]|nr:hypothetical protein CN374_00070 [Bacillus cereus]
MKYYVKIEEQKKEKQRILNEIKVKKELLLEELINFTNNWFEEHTLFAITANADKVVALGEQQARELKGKINELQKNSSELVQKYVSGLNSSRHTNEDEDIYYTSTGDLRDKYEKAIKSMFGELGVILIQYGLVTDDGECEGIWKEKTRDGIRRRKIIYNDSIIYSDELYKIYSEYEKLISQAQTVNEKIEDLKEKKKRENIEEWWKSL